MWGAGLAFVVDAIVAVLVTLRDHAQAGRGAAGPGLRHGERRTSTRRDVTHAWWESPELLGFVTLGGAAILTIVFW